MIEIKQYNQYPKAVYINGRILPMQLPTDPIVKGGILSVRIITDKRIKRAVNISAVPFWHRAEVHPATNKAVETTTLYFHYNRWEDRFGQTERAFVSMIRDTDAVIQSIMQFRA